MLPSLVVEEVRRGVAETLRAQFEPSNAFFKTPIRQLIEAPSWIKGPYVQLGLPFVAGASGRDFFPAFKTEHPAHRHQELAWERCARQERSTLIATGTGSGKTECFLYPLLEHVAQARARGEPGIKAILIYPMNALADDQAGRIAELVARTPAFAGIRAGLFVGSGRVTGNPRRQGKPPQPDHLVMGRDHVITDKAALRADPPDILLTNYKMLDFLLIRPRDQRLWQHNSPGRLRYLVVDELHTFDGAQGTDLAMLIRRLRRRLGCQDDGEGDGPDKGSGEADRRRGGLICIGTSATLGDASDTAPLRDYAGQVFATHFDDDAVITEHRQGFDAFIGDNVVEYLLADEATAVAALQPQHFGSPAAAVAACLPIFFADPEVQSALLAGLETTAGRLRLGQELKKHLLFQTLLRTAAQAPVTVDSITDRMQRTLGAGLRDHAPALLSALLTLVAWARAPYAGQQVTDQTPVSELGPLVTLRVQLWLQELRRLVATVAPDADTVILAAEAGILNREERLRLPLVQCRHCRTTGWLTLKSPQEQRVSASLENIYPGFFAHNKDSFLTRIYPRFEEAQRLLAKAQAMVLCGRCGHLESRAKGQCVHCQSEELVPVHVLAATRRKTFASGPEGAQQQREVTVHDDTCPVCGQRDELLILGAQTTTIAAHAVERLWSTPLNPHRKLILFSDSVQDAAHRAGYVESKTETHLLRSGIARALATQADEQPWDQALTALAGAYRSEQSPLCMTPEDFVARFIAPGMDWLNDWQTLMQTGALPAGSDLPQWLAQRMQWQAAADLAHRSDLGRTLSRTGVAALFPDTRMLETLADDLTRQLREAGGGLESLGPAQVFHWSLGTVLLLIRHGAILHLGLEWVAEGGDFGAFEYQRRPWMPHSGGVRHPRFLTRDPGRHGFLHLREEQANPLMRWAQLALGPGLLAPGILTLAYERLIAALVSAGIGRQLPMNDQYSGNLAFGLEPARLRLCQQLRRLVTPSGAQSLWAPEAEAECLRGMPAWDRPGECWQPECSTAANWWRERLLGGEVHRVIAHEHTGLLERDERVELQNRFMANPETAAPWFENLLSATPTLEMGINIGALSSVMLGGVPPNPASFIQRVGRAGRLDGNAAVFTIADASPDGHDQYFFSEPLEMLAGTVEAPAIYLGAAEVLRRQLYAFFFDHWVAEEAPQLPDKLSEALDCVASGEVEPRRFPFDYLDFVNRKEPELFEAFCRLLGRELTPATREKLEAYVAGTAQRQNLRTRFLSFFEDSLAERESWKSRRKRLNREMARLRKLPQDEQVISELDTLDKQRAALGQRIQQLNNEQLLEAMTNAGLLPNYAFPEEGVSLTTIVHAKSPAQGQPYTAPLHRYSRPAHAALAEFAPRNTFFAHKSKVRIDQIDMSVEPAQGYRFCARCEFLAALGDPAAGFPACPKCGDTQWEDESQVRPMLRLRRAVANIERKDRSRTRITEHDEGRKPLYYQRRLLMNFEPTDVRNAWTLASDAALYGFEYLARARFHDINLGQPSLGAQAGQDIQIAGDDSPKTGFTLCKGCGKVQRSSRPGQAASESSHAPDCPHRHDRTQAHLLDALFLFREFESECLRILVPTGFGAGDRTTYSFMAALQLGLRERFGGKVDHLRFEVMQEPGGEGAAGKTYILVYDSVPGGTGYLQQLLSGEADTLSEVLAAAYRVIQSCGCQDQAELDGCYRCVLHYRQGRNRRHVSRQAALEMLRELVEGAFKPTQVKTLSELLINPDFGSELERRFLPALQTLGGQVGVAGEPLPSVQYSQDIKAGRTAYLLQVGDNSYWVDTQVEIEDPATGAVLCVPDFVISPTRTASAMRPLAVFVDGWEWHKDILSEDARKRLLLMLRGDYRVWNITYEDIEASRQRKAGTDLEGPLGLLMTDSGRQIPDGKLPAIPGGALSSNALALLVDLLGTAEAGAQDPLTRLEPVGRHLLMRTVRRSVEMRPELVRRIEQVLAVLPEWLRETGRAVPLHSPGGLDGEGVRALVWAGRADAGYLSGKPSADWPVAGGLILDEGPEAEARQARIAWRQWLRLGNLLQGTAGVRLLTRQQLHEGQELYVPPASGGRAAIADDGWQALLDEEAFLQRLRPGFASLAAAGLPTPEVGVEIEAGADYRAAEALWEPARVVLLTRVQQPCAESWRAAGYAVIEERDDWWLQVEQCIGERSS